MAGNHVLLETIELTQSAATVTFDNIPQTGYSDLKIVASTRGAQSGVAEANRIRFNGDTTNTNYTGRRLLGSGSAVSSDQTTTIVPGFFNNLSSSTANTFSNSEVYIPGYLSSNSKSYSVDTVTENNATEAYMAIVAGRWSGTAAISSITFVPESGNSYVAGSTFSLYGVAATGTTPAVAPKATGGNIVANDGTYWYHAFLTSGNFVPQTDLTCNYLVVAGGGGGAGDVGGGGGAGGLRSTVTATGGGGSLESPLSLTSSISYAVTIGAGGSGGVADVGTSGSDSTFSTITSTGGGRGGRSGTTGAVGGSGGAGSGRGQVTGYVGLGGAGTPNQGYAGGNGVGDSSVSGQSGGGGGGAGAVGATSTVGTGGNGGAGVAIPTFAAATNTGVSNYYAGGGGGAVYTPGTNGTGGAGGGGNVATAGTRNTGSGGGAAIGGATTGGAGASGIVIIRYAMV